MINKEIELKINMEKENKKCPRCGKKISKYPALSRRDNKTNVCSECGSGEALIDLAMNSSSFSKNLNNAIVADELRKEYHFMISLIRKK